MIHEIALVGEVAKVIRFKNAGDINRKPAFAEKNGQYNKQYNLPASKRKRIDGQHQHNNQKWIVRNKLSGFGS